MVGQLYCVESDCVTVWAKIPGQAEIKRERVKAGNVKVTTNLEHIHYWRLNGVNTNYTNGLSFNNIVDWRIEHEGNYCQVNLDNFVYYNVINDADFEILTGQDWNGVNGLSVPRMQVKRLILGRNLNTGFTFSNSLLIKYSQDTDNSSSCNLQDLDPRDYGGTSPAWYDPFTNLVIHSGTEETASFIGTTQSGYEFSLEATNRWSRTTYAFQGQEPFDLEWTRIDETETIIDQEEKQDTWQAFKVEKEPFIEKVEVVDYAYNFGFGGILIAGNPTIELPRNCLNIYKSQTNPQTNDVVFPHLASNTEFIDQFCTDDPADTAPPEYFVVCGCDKCPPGTCEVDCGDHICCYNSQGVAEITINK